MADFDPDAYLSRKRRPAAAPAARPFDPDAYLAARKAKPEVSQLESGLKGAEQGVTLGFADEFRGNIKQLIENIRNTPGDLKALLSGEATLQELTERNLNTYRQARDAERETVGAARAANPKTFLAGEVVGGVAVPVPGAPVKSLGTAIKAGAKLGAGAGLGHSEADLTRGEVGSALVDTGVGAGFGVAGGAAGHGIGKVAGVGLNKARELLERVRGRATRGIEEAGERAQAIAAEKVDKEIASLRGAAGGEVQKASRMSENIRRIDPNENLGDAAAQARMNREAAKAAREKAAQMRNAVDASDVGEVVDAAGALMSKGSKAEKAFRQREQVRKLEEFATAAEGHADDLERGFAQPGDSAGLKALREAALDSPELAAIENQVLLRNLQDLPQQHAAANAAMGALRTAQQNRPSDIAAKAADLLSGKAAREAIGARIRRYGPPLAASAAGAMFGGPLGAGVGAAAGLAAGRGLEALAGAGLRPALRSWINLFTKYPAVQARTWGAVRRMASADPTRLGPYGERLAMAAGRGEKALEEAHQQLLSDPGYLIRLAELFGGEDEQMQARR